jgi:hypothetical protein
MCINSDGKEQERDLSWRVYCLVADIVFDFEIVLGITTYLTLMYEN